jgi:hypothetical protein
MLRTPPHPGNPADRTERLLAATRLPTGRPTSSREATP